MVAVGDVNTGGNDLSQEFSLYPSPLFPTSTNRVPTINGPAIRGAFVNNTRQGFIIGTGSVSVGGGAVDAASHLVGAASDIIEWVAYLDDISM